MTSKILTIISLFILFSCGNSEIYNDVVEFPNSQMEWNKNANFEFTLNGEDQLMSYLHIQHNNEYPYQNVYFFSEVKYPDGNIKQDTLQYMLAKPSGEWLGSGMGASKQMYLHYPINLNQKGVYSVSILQAMREDTLVGIEKLAFSIQQNKN